MIIFLARTRSIDTWLSRSTRLTGLAACSPVDASCLPATIPLERRSGASLPLSTSLLSFSTFLLFSTASELLLSRFWLLPVFGTIQISCFLRRKHFGKKASVFVPAKFLHVSLIFASKAIYILYYL